MSTGFIKKLDPPHSFPFVTNPKAIIVAPIPFSQLPPPADLSGTISNTIYYNPFFNPSLISNLILWLDANDTSTFSNNNFNWKDKSFNSYTSTYIQSYQKIPKAFRKISVEGLLYVDGSAAYTIQVPNFTMRPIFTLFLVATTEMGLFDILHPNPTSDYLYNIYIRTWGANLFRSTGLLLSDSTSFGLEASVVPLNEFFIFCIGYNMTNTAIPYRVNGINRTSYVSNNGAVINQYFTSMLSFSGWTDNNSYPALVGEFIIFDRSISQEECENIEGYLAQKWNLQDKLPQTHPYKMKGPNLI